MNILMVAGPVVSLKEPYNGGTEPFIVNIANILVEQGHTVDVVAKEAEERHTFQLIEFDESPLSMKDDIHPEWQGQEYYRVFQYALMNMSRYDIIHYHSFIPELYDAGSFFDVPSVLTLHVPPDDKFKKVYGLFARRTSATCVAISQRMHDAWQPIISTPISTIPNGIATADWASSERKEGQYLLWSGRLNPDKNPLDAIKVALHMGYRLKIAGKITDQHYFNRHIKPQLRGSIEYVGHVTQDELMVLAQSAEVFLATALWEEPFGFSALEMLASGVPVVGYASALPEELRYPGVSIAVPTRHWQDMVPAIVRARKADPGKCQAFAERFGLEKMAARYIDLYTSLLEKSERA